MVVVFVRGNTTPNPKISFLQRTAHDRFQCGIFSSNSHSIPTVNNLAYTSHHNQLIHINLLALMRYTKRKKKSTFEMTSNETMKWKQTISSDSVSWVKYKLYGDRGLTKRPNSNMCIRRWLVNNMISSNGYTIFCHWTLKNIINFHVIWWPKFAIQNATLVISTVRAINSWRISFSIFWINFLLN